MSNILTECQICVNIYVKNVKHNMFVFGFLGYVHSSNKIFKFVTIDKIVLDEISRKHVMNIPSCLKHIFFDKFCI